MAIIENDLSNRIAHFDSETGNPINEPYWSGLFKNLKDRIWSDIGNPKSEVSRQIVEDTFNGIRDSFTGTLLASSLQQFESYCRCNGIKFEVNECGNYILQKDWDNFVMNNGKLYHRSLFI